MKPIKHYVLFLIVMIFTSSLYSQRLSWYFPEYKYYLRATGNCDRTIKQSIWGWQYLEIKIYDECRQGEVSCYRSKDSTLKEKGNYYVTADTLSIKGTKRNAGTDSVTKQRTQHIIFKRVGTWRVYDKTGKVIKAIEYPPVPVSHAYSEQDE